MASVGIMSMQRIVNYGSFLQAYGLKAMLEELGHEVQFVDYYVGDTLVKSKTDRHRGILRKMDKAFESLMYDAPMLQKLQFIKYKKAFANKYHRILGITKNYNYTPELDVLVIGSDEVFNCVQSNPNVGYSPQLFGKDNRAKKVITYAASFGNTTIEKLQKYDKAEEVGKLLEKFDAISVRDDNTAKIVNTLSGKTVEQHIDPVLAYDFVGNCEQIPKMEVKEKYLILYAYSGRISQEESDWISTYAKKKGLKIYAIGGVQRCADRYIDCSPFEVISYFMNAEEVITDTFHGTIFSVITKRRFATIVRKSTGNSYGNEEKITDLLMRLGLANRGVYQMDSIPDILREDIDYVSVDKKLEQARASAHEYLLDQIQ